MKTALWIIAICEAIRTVQNTVQLWWIHGSERREYKQREMFLRKGLETFEKSLKEVDDGEVHQGE